jgi:hypothetical protein
MPLPEERRAQLDSIVSKMAANGEADTTIQTVVNDFKTKYDNPAAMTLPDLPKPRPKVEATGLFPQYNQMGQAIQNRQPKPTPQAAGALGAMLSAGTGGAGAVAVPLFGALAGLTTNSENVGGMAAASGADMLMNLHPATRAMNLAGKGAITGASYLAGQAATGETPTPGQAGAIMGTSTLLPPVVKGLGNMMVNKPVANSLFTKSKDATARVMQALGLTDDLSVVAKVGAAAGAKEAEAKAPVLATQAAKSAQPETDAALAKKVTDSLNKAHKQLTTEQGFSDADVKGIPFLLSRKNPELAQRLVNNPTPETIAEAAEFYKQDRAQNVIRRILAGKSPDDYNTPLDPEMARMGQSVLNNPGSVPPEVLERYKPQLNNLAPALFGKDFNNVMGAAKSALARDTAGKFNINAPASPEVKALGQINKTFFGNLKPGTSTPRLAVEARQAAETAKQNFVTFGVKPTGADLTRLQELAKDQPEVFFSRMAKGGASAINDARVAAKLLPGERNALAGGAVQRMFEGARDAEGRIMNIGAQWKKSEPVFRELLGDEAKVAQLGHFVDDLQKSQNRLEQAGHGMHMLVGVGGVAAFLRYGAHEPLIAGSAAAAGGGVWLAIKWPKVVDLALTNPTLGKEFANYAGKAGTQGGLQISRNLANWLTANGTTVNQAVQQPQGK